MKFSQISKALTCLALLFLLSCNQDDPFRIDFSTVPPPFDLTGITPDVRESGLIIYQVEEGTGPFEVTRRDVVFFYYTGRLSSGRVFDSTYANGNDSPRTSGDLGRFVVGFTEGLLGMKINEKRTLIIPPELAYGDAPRGSSNFDLRNDTLFFDVEIAQFNN